MPCISKVIIVLPLLLATETFLSCCSYKFGRKLSYINRLEELEHVLNLEELDIPDEVKQSVTEE